MTFLQFEGFEVANNQFSLDFSVKWENLEFEGMFGHRVGTGMDMGIELTNTVCMGDSVILIIGDLYDYIYVI